MTVYFSLFGNAMKLILICTDGEEHTLKAEEQALTIGERFGASVMGLYVQSPFLKKFTHEIYAVNRNECRQHLDEALRREGVLALEALGRRCGERGVSYDSKIREGDIVEEIVDEASTGGYDLLVMGAKLLNTWRERLESVNIPLAVFKRSPIPTLFVR
jgi:nucleotide-binding universal stress UspA family protein